MSEQNSEHIRQAQEKHLDYAYSQVRLGQYLGFLLGLPGLGVVAFCAYLGLEFAATAIGTTGVGALAATFLRSSKSE